MPKHRTTAADREEIELGCSLQQTADDYYSPEAAANLTAAELITLIKAIPLRTKQAARQVMAAIGRIPNSDFMQLPAAERDAVQRKQQEVHRKYPGKYAAWD